MYVLYILFMLFILLVFVCISKYLYVICIGTYQYILVLVCILWNGLYWYAFAYNGTICTYWWVLVGTCLYLCVLVLTYCVLVCFGMYCMCKRYLYVLVSISQYFMYWPAILVCMVCIACIGIYCIVLKFVCIVWYVLYALVCVELYLYVLICIDL